MLERKICRQTFRFALFTLSVATSTFLCAAIWAIIAFVAPFTLDIRAEIVVFWVAVSMLTACFYPQALKVFELETIRTRNGTNFVCSVLTIAVFLICTKLIYEFDLKIFSNSLINANDGNGHLAILEGLIRDHTTGVYPLLVDQDHSTTSSGSPYPIGAHFVSFALSRSAQVPITVS